VLDACAGYLMLAERLAVGGPRSTPEAMNFGPPVGRTMTVADLAGKVLVGLGTTDTWRADDRGGPEEKRELALDATRALETLGWHPHLDVHEAVQWTIDWYRTHDADEDMRDFTQAQIDAFGELE